MVSGMDTLKKPIHSSTADALVPKMCRFCHLPMEIKQINLTEAVRQCHKCSTPLQQLDLNDIEFFHRSYKDVNKKNPADWSPIVSTEEDELNKLQSWIEHLSLTLNSYEDSSDDDMSRTASGSESQVKLEDHSKLLEAEVKFKNLIGADIGNSQTNHTESCDWNLDAMLELDAALEKASVEKSDPSSFPFSLDDFFLPDKQILQKPTLPSVSASSTSLSDAADYSKQICLSEAAGSTCVQSDNASNNLSDDTVTKKEDKILHQTAYKFADHDDNCPEIPSPSSEISSNLHKFADHDDNCPEIPSPSSEMSSNLHNNSEEEISTEVFASDALDDLKKTKNCHKSLTTSTVTPNQIVMTFPSQSLAYKRICDCDDTSLLLHPPSSGLCDNHCIDFKLPPLPQFKEKIMEDNFGESADIHASEVEKIIFSPTHLALKAQCDSSLKRTLGKSDLKSHEVTKSYETKDASLPTGNVDEEILFESACLLSPEASNVELSAVREAQNNFAGNIVVTVPADVDITEDMLQSFSFDDLPILIGCSNGFSSTNLVKSETCDSEQLLFQNSEEIETYSFQFPETTCAHETPTQSPSPAFSERCYSRPIITQEDSPFDGNLQYTGDTESIQLKGLGSGDKDKSDGKNVDTCQSNHYHSPEQSNSPKSLDNFCGGDSQYTGDPESIKLRGVGSSDMSDEKNIDNIDACQSYQYHSPERSNSSISLENSCTLNQSQRNKFVSENFSALVNQSLQPFNTPGEEEDDELSFFKGTKCKPIGVRKKL